MFKLKLLYPARALPVAALANNLVQVEYQPLAS
jgi:hypothetical protein